MARLVLLKNPLRITDREVIDLPAGTPVIDWLQRHYPAGFGAGLRFLVNGVERDLDDLDHVAADDDTITLAVCPAGLEAIWVPLVISLVISAVSLAITMLLAPAKSPAFSNERTPSTVYSIGSQQNAARLGEPVPVVYGAVLTTPDYASQPYSYFQNNQQYLDTLMVLSQGECDVEAILIGDTNITILDGGVVSWKLIAPGEHRQRVGNLGFLPDFFENIVTVPEVGDQDFAESGDGAGFFRLSKTGQRGRVISVDLEFQGGLYRMDTWGNINRTNVEVWVEVIEVDDAGNPLTDRTRFLRNIESGFANDPYRVTITVDMGRTAQWAVRLSRKTNQDSTGKRMDKFTWTGLKMQVDIPPDQTIYGNVTLLAVRIRASLGVSQAGAQQIRVRARRRLPTLGSGVAQPTTSPADAFVDIYTNSDYGARRPLGEMDIDRLAALRSWWGPYAFNAVFTGRTTVWEALANCVQGMAAAPLPLGARMSIVQDGIKDVRSQIFSEQNIGDRSLTLHYEFDEVGRFDGVEIEFRDPANFAPAFAIVPANAVDPEKIVLFGCTDETHAGEYGQLIWNRRQRQRRSLEFETEMEGLIPYPGERVAVQHSLPFWGVSGFVIDVSQLPVLLLDRELPWAGSGNVMMLRDQYGQPTGLIPVTPGQTSRHAVLSFVPPGFVFHVGERAESTHFMFGTASSIVRDFILTGLKPNDANHVTVTGVIYEPGLYAGTMSFLATPVPA